MAIGNHGEKGYKALLVIKVIIIKKVRSKVLTSEVKEVKSL
jgi:hypothetical protein